MLFKCLYRLFWWSYKSTSASGWYSNPAFSVIPPCSVCYSTVSLVRNSPRTTTPGYVATRLKSSTFWFLLCFNILNVRGLSPSVVTPLAVLGWSASAWKTHDHQNTGFTIHFPFFQVCPWHTSVLRLLLITSQHKNGKTTDLIFTTKQTHLSI